MRWTAVEVRLPRESADHAQTPVSRDGLTDRLIALLGLPETDPEVRDIARTLRGALDAALQTDQQELLVDALRFAHGRLMVRGLSPASSSDVAEALGEAAASPLSAPERGRVHSLISRCLADLADSQPGDVRELQAMTAAYLERLMQGDRRGAVEVARQCVSAGMSMLDILLDVLEPAQHEVGRRWALGHISVAQEHFCTAVTQFVMTDLYPDFFSGEDSRRRLVAVHVPGSTHHIGLRMVTDVLECRDWSTTYVVEDVPPHALPRLVAEDQADLLLISASMAGHVSQVGEMIRAVREDPRTRDVKVVVGGRPFSLAPDLVRTVGADGWASDARSAVEVCDALVEEEK